MNAKRTQTPINASTPMTLQVAASLDELQPWARQWDELAITMPQKLAVLSHAWISTYFRHRVAMDEQWFCVLAHVDDKLLGVLPLVVKRRKVLGVPVCVLATPFDWHTASSDCAVAPGMEQDVIPALISKAFDHVPKAAWMEIIRLPESSPTLAFARRTTGLAVTFEPDARGSFFPASGDFDSYYESLSGDFRRKLRRGMRGLERDCEHEITFRAVTEDWQPELERLLDLEEAGWKGDTGSAIRASDSLVAFYRDVAFSLAERGWLELYLLENGSQVLAALFGIRFAGSITLLKTCYDEQHRRHSPGNVALFHVIQRAFSLNDIQRVDGMTWAPYHERWDVSYCRYHHVRMYRPGWKSYLLGRLPRGVHQWARGQSWLRSLLGKKREDQR